METIHNRLSQFRSNLHVSMTNDDGEKQHKCIDMNLYAPCLRSLVRDHGAWGAGPVPGLS